MPNILSGEQAKPETPIIIALRIERAAAAIDVSEDYLRQAIREGRLKATEKKAPGKGRGIKLVLVDELRRFAETDELGTDEQPTNCATARKE